MAAVQRSGIVRALITQSRMPRRAQKREEVLSQRRNPGAPLTVCLLPLSGDVDLPRLWGDLVGACRPEGAQPPATPRADRPQGMELEEEHLPTREQGPVPVIRNGKEPHRHGLPIWPGAVLHPWP